jgi:hypothetical protein
MERTVIARDSAQPPDCYYSVDTLESVELRLAGYHNNFGVESLPSRKNLSIKSRLWIRSPLNSDPSKSPSIFKVLMHVSAGALTFSG